MSRIPPYLTVADVARACGMSRRAALGLLRRARVAQKVGGRWVAGESRLRDVLPEVYDRVWSASASGDTEAGNRERE